MNEALSFYKAVYQEFPTDRLAELINLIETDQIDCWRSFGTAISAIENHSKKADGVSFSLAKYEANRQRLDALREQFAPDALFQI